MYCRRLGETSFVCSVGCFLNTMYNVVPFLAVKWSLQVSLGASTCLEDLEKRF